MIFVLIGHRSLLRNFIGELQEAFFEFTNDPKGFIADLFRGELGPPRPNLPIGIRFALFLWLFSLIGGVGWYVGYGWYWGGGSGHGDGLVRLAYVSPIQSVQWLHYPFPGKRISGSGKEYTREMLK